MTAVSVILPVYNGGTLLAPALRSVLDQTFQDFEVLVIDDGSNDNSVKKCEESVEDPRVHFIYQENLGLAATLNKGIAIARSPLIARMDADDICDPARLERQVNWLNRNPDTVLVGGQIERLVEDSRAGESKFPLTHEEIVRGLLRGQHVLCHPSIMFRRDVAMQVGCYWDQGVSEDWDFFLKMSDVGRLENIDDIVLRYRYHGGGINAQSMNEVRRNIFLSIHNYRARGKGWPEWDIATFDKRASNLAKLRIRAESISLQLYRRSMIAQALGRKTTAAGLLIAAGLLWPDQALRRVSKAYSINRIFARSTKPENKR